MQILHKRSLVKKPSSNYIKLVGIVLLFSFVLHFVSLFFGFDLSDEGYAMLLSIKAQDVGTLGVHFYHLTRYIPTFSNFPVTESRVIRTMLLIISTTFLYLTTKSIKTNRNGITFFILAASLSLLSLADGIKVLSYNSINAVLLILYSGFITLYCNSKNRTVSQTSLLFSTMLLSITYIIRLPSFFLYVLIHFLFILLHSGISRRFVLHLVFSVITLFGSLIYLNEVLYPINNVFLDIRNSSSLSLHIDGKHGPIQSIFNTISLIQMIVVLAITAYSLVIIDSQIVQNIKNKTQLIFLRVALILVILFVLFMRPLSYFSPIIFFFSISLILYFKKNNGVLLYEDKRKEILFSFLVILLAIAATFGTLAPGITMLTMYVPLLIVPFYFFMPTAKKHQLLLILFIVIISSSRVIINELINPYRQGSLIEKHHIFSMRNGKNVMLDEKMFNYVSSVNDFIKNQNLYNREIIAVDRLPGLVYLLDTNMPSSVLFSYEYWSRYCNDLKPMKLNPVIIVREEPDDLFYNCLLEHADINFHEDYQLGTVIENAYNGFNRKTKIYIPIEK